MDTEFVTALCHERLVVSWWWYVCIPQLKWCTITNTPLMYLQKLYLRTCDNSFREPIVKQKRMLCIVSRRDISYGIWVRSDPGSRPHYTKCQNGCAVITQDRSRGVFVCPIIVLRVTARRNTERHNIENLHETFRALCRLVRSLCVSVVETMTCRIISDSISAANRLVLDPVKASIAAISATMRHLLYRPN